MCSSKTVPARNVQRSTSREPQSVLRTSPAGVVLSEPGRSATACFFYALVSGGRKTWVRGTRKSPTMSSKK
eukprot:6516926-Pyramimonas_sp.AAC.1